MTRPSLALRAVFAAAVAGFLVGSGIVATRFVIAETTPAALAFLRYAIGLVCFLLPILLTSWPRFQPRDLLPIALLGIGQFGILIVLLNYGLQFMPSARGALIFATFPLMTMLLAAGMGKESLTRYKILGVTATFTGVALVLGEKALLAGSSGWWGEIAVLGSAFCGALCSVLYRPYLQRYPPLSVSAFAMLASVLFLAVLAGADGFFATVPDFTAGGWFAIVFIGISSGVGYFLWLWALKHTTPTRVAVFLSLSPITATILGALVLSEPVSAYFLAGLAAVALGLVIAHREK
ncbi:MAG: EamA family transporter [Alphaproteobacteria bacterium]|nr:EamA family transporter [Alphaproteobacteria bacterium]